MLHIAPETFLHDHFKTQPGLTLLSTDLFPEKLRLVGGHIFRSNIEALALPDQSVDLVVCLHVLEHVTNDHRGIQEMFRVLRPQGQALIMIPLGLHLPETVEHPEGKPLYFGHLRDYSPHDVPKRLAPFEVTVVKREDFLSAQECQRFGVPAQEILFRCRRPESPIATHH